MGETDVNKQEQVQYCVILREGENAGKKQEFHVSKEQIQRVFDSCKFSDNGKTILYMGHIAGNERGEIPDEIYINKNRLDSLLLKAKNEKTTNRCAEYYKFPIPFPEFKNNS